MGEDPVKIKLRKLRWRDRHPEYGRVSSKLWRIAHPDHGREYARRWRANNRDKLLARTKRWRDENREALKLQRILGGMSLKDARAMIAAAKEKTCPK